MDKNIRIEQEPWSNVMIRLLRTQNIWKNILFTNISQLLPVWIMLLIKKVSMYYFNISDYICNMLVFVMIACVTNISDLLGKRCKNSDISLIFAIFIHALTLCFSSTLYCLVLLSTLKNLDIKIKNSVIMNFSIFFILVEALISIWQVSRKELKWFY